MGQEEEGEGQYDHFEKKLMRAVIVNKEEKLRS